MRPGDRGALRRPSGCRPAEPMVFPTMEMHHGLAAWTSSERAAARRRISDRGVAKESWRAATRSMRFARQEWPGTLRPSDFGGNAGGGVFTRRTAIPLRPPSNSRPAAVADGGTCAEAPFAYDAFGTVVSGRVPLGGLGAMRSTPRSRRHTQRLVPFGTGGPGARGARKGMAWYWRKLAAASRTNQRIVGGRDCGSDGPGRCFVAPRRGARRTACANVDRASASLPLGRS